MNDIEELVKYYQNLLIIQYHNKPKAKAVIGLLARELADAWYLLKQVQDCFNLEVAVGKQLDILAKYYGISRDWAGIDFSNKYFDYQYTDENHLRPVDPVPYRDGLGYQTLNNRGEGYYQTLIAKRKASYSLTDYELRNFIKLRIIALVNEKITYQYLYDEMFRLFHLLIIPIALDDMTLEFYFDPTLTHLAGVLNEYKEFLPAPAGVGIKIYNYLPSDEKLFTFKTLTMNGGKNYNRYQIGMGSKYRPYVGKWRVNPNTIIN